MTWLQIILVFTAMALAAGLLSIIVWLIYTGYLNSLQRKLAVRKGIYREVVAGMAARDHALLEPELKQLRTLRDFQALEALLEEQARSATERPAWLLDAYDRLGLVDQYIERLSTAKKWRERAFAAELLGRVGNAKAVPALLETIQATRTEDADVREISLRALARIADPRAVEPLIGALKRAEIWLAPRIADILVRHGDPVIDPMIAFLDEQVRHPARAWAANILGELKATRGFPALVRALGDLDDEIRAKAAGALGRLGDHRAVTYLLDHLLTDPAPFVRARIAGALGQFNDTEVIDRLVRALGDPAWWVRMRSVEALEQIGPVAEAPLLLALDDPDPEIRIRAAVALERLGVPNRLIARIAEGSAEQAEHDTLIKFAVAGAHEMLAEHLLHTSPSVRAAVIEAVHRAQRAEMGPELIERVQTDADPAIRAAALTALHALGIREALPAALASLADGNERVRASAMALLGDLGGSDLVSLIGPRSADSEPVVRAAAARALGLVKAHGAHAEFIRLLRDPVADVRAAAADGVADANIKAAGGVLTDLLGDSNAEVQLAAARALGVLGHVDALPVLLRTFRDADATLRQTIIKTVALIQPGVLEELIDILLERQDAASRVSATLTIGHLRTPQAFRLLERLWRDDAPEVRVAVAEMLSRFDPGNAGDLLSHGLKDPEAEVRARSIDGLVKLQRADLGERITLLLSTDPSPLVRERAGLAVGLLRLPGGEAQLLLACQPDQPLAVRAAAILAIGTYDHESVVARVLEMGDEEALRDLIRERLKLDPEFRLLGLRLRDSRHIELRALGATSREQMEQILAEGMRGVLSAEQRVRLVAGLKAFQGDRSRSALLQVIRSDPSPEVRAAALIAVGGMLDPDELFITAARALSDPHPGVRHAAIAQFQHIAPAKALPALVRQLKGDEDPVTLQAVAQQAEAAFDPFVDLALGAALGGQESMMVARVAKYMHHPGVARVLSAVSRSESSAVREAVADTWSQRPDLLDPAALEAMTTDPAVTVRRASVAAWLGARRFDRLAAMLDDPDPGVRLELALAFHTAPDADALAALSADPDEMVRAAVFSSQLLRGEITQPPPGARLSRAAAASAVRRAQSLETLRDRARTMIDPTQRAAAALALAVLDDEVAYAVVGSDPVATIRDQVGRMLTGWRDTPEPESPA